MCMSGLFYGSENEELANAIEPMASNKVRCFTISCASNGNLIIRFAN